MAKKPTSSKKAAKRAVAKGKISKAIRAHMRTREGRTFEAIPPTRPWPAPKPKPKPGGQNG